MARELIAADKKLAEAGDVVSLRRSGGEAAHAGLPSRVYRLPKSGS